MSYSYSVIAYVFDQLKSFDLQQRNEHVIKLSILNRTDTIKIVSSSSWKHEFESISLTISTAILPKYLIQWKNTFHFRANLDFF